LTYGLKVTFGRDRKTRFENIDIQRFELPCHSQLLVDVHAETGSLLPVSQCGVENDYFVVHLFLTQNRSAFPALCVATARRYESPVTISL
jgi:hypothetical protein